MSISTEDMIKDKRNFINIAPDGIKWGFHANFKVEDDGMYSWYIPSFDIYFSSRDKAEGDKIAIAATNAFFEFWLKKQSFRKFVNKILSLGYKPNSFNELQSLLQRKNINAKLIGINRKLPSSFIDSKEYQMSGALETAV